MRDIEKEAGSLHAWEILIISDLDTLKVNLNSKSPTVRKHSLQGIFQL